MREHGIRWNARIAATANALYLAGVSLTVHTEYDRINENSRPLRPLKAHGCAHSRLEASFFFFTPVSAIGLATFSGSATFSLTLDIAVPSIGPICFCSSNSEQCDG
jgi:hypothetical protein